MAEKIALDARLSAVAELIPAGSRVADIGTDHGYLPLFLVSSGKCPFAVASDRSAPSCAKAQVLIAASACADRMDARVGDGLSVLRPGEVDTVAIAGMGGILMISILSAAPQITAGLKRLVLQPQKDVSRLRRWLADNGWCICAERLAADNGFYYPVLAAEPGQMSLNETEEEFGPFLLRDRPPVLKEYLQFRLHGIRQVRQSLNGQKGREVLPRMQELDAEEKKFMELLKVL